MMNDVVEIFRKQKKNANIISKKENISPFRLWINWVYCFLRYGATPSEWYINKMYKYRHNHLKKIITRRGNIELDYKFNPREYQEIFDNKKLFNEYFDKFVNRKWYVYPLMPLSEIRNIKWTGKIVVKPISQSSGRGIFTFDPEKDDWRDLEKKIEGNEYLFEECVQLHPLMRELNPPSCNTFRVYTVIDRNGKVNIVGATMKVGGSNSIQDNFHANGVLYPIEVDFGLINRPGKDLMGNEYVIHPSTKIKVVGFEIPQWPEVIEFVKDAARVVSEARFIGWDVALTPNGCEMIEGNYYPSCNGLQIFDGEGKYYELKKYL